MAAERSMHEISAENIDCAMITILTTFKFGISSTNLPKHQIKTLAKVSCYTVCILHMVHGELGFLQECDGGGRRELHCTYALLYMYRM